MSERIRYPESFLAVSFRAPRVASLPDGRLLVLREPGFEETDRAILHLCPARPAKEGLDGQGLALIAPRGGSFTCRAAAPLVAGIWTDDGGRLWLAWSDGHTVSLRRTREPVGDLDTLANPGVWQTLDPILPAPVAGSSLWHLGSGVRHPTEQDSILLSVLELPAGRVHVIAAAEGGPVRHAALHTHPQNHAPAIAMDPDGACCHVVWATEDLRICYRRVELSALAEGRVSEEEPFRVWIGCHHPDVATNGRQVIVSYTGHMQHITYGYFDGQDWQLDKHLTTLHPRFSETLEHSPWLWTDDNGAIHVSFVCLTRCLVYDSKWLGDAFSDPQPVEGLFHPSLFVDEVRVRAERMSLERRGGRLLLSSSFLPERHGVYTRQQESVTLKPDEPLLMFDMDAIDELYNAKVGLATMSQDPPAPLFEPTDRKQDFDGSRVLNGGTVLKDGDRYRMWYGAVALEPVADVPWYDQVYVGYAESEDGVQWQRADTGNGETYRGHPAPNRIRNMDHNACVFVDPEDDPSRRYKAVKFESRAQRYDRVAATGELGYLGLPRRGWLSTSADGLRWEREEIVVDFPGVETYGCQPQGAIYDPRDPDPARRYKVVGFTSIIGRRRGATLACSPDCRYWTVAERTPLLDSMMAVTPVRPAGPYGQLHDATIVRYGRYLLVFYQYQFDGRSADIRLAVSRNGARFKFVFPETPLIARGEPGRWNSGYLMPSSFVLDGDRMFCYYAAHSDEPYETVYGLPIVRVCAGRAVALRDRFARVSPGKTGDMTLATAPVTVQHADEPLRLEINADLSAESRLRVGLADADVVERELPGFEIESCGPLSGDSLRHRVAWKGGERLPPSLRRFRVRMLLEGSSKDAVYSLRVVSENEQA
ncbi:MAG: hypothetical protein KKD33_03115 [Verrucomicrobia bacterium]|nr:hypothetical protein [Verrucomicrobiota bacterium]